MGFRASLVLLAIVAVFAPSSSLKCNGVIDTPKVIEEDVDFSSSFCTLRDVTVKGSVIGNAGAVLVTEGTVTILGSVLLNTDAGATLGGNLDIHGELNVQGPIGKNPVNGIDKVVVGNAVINKVVISNMGAVSFNGSHVGSVEMLSGTSGLITLDSTIGNGGISMLNQANGRMNLQGTEVIGPVKISEVQDLTFGASSSQNTRTELQGGLFVKQASGIIRASETRFEGSKLEITEFNGVVGMGDIGIPDTTIQRLRGTLQMLLGLEGSLKILDSTGAFEIVIAPSSKGPVEIKNSHATGSLQLAGVLGDIAVIGNQGFHLTVTDNIGRVLIVGNSLQSLKCTENVITGNATGQCDLSK